MNEQRESIMDAVQNHLKHVIVPVLYDYDDKGIDQVGSASLLERGSDLYLLSALHTFQRMKAEKFIIPANYNAGYDLVSIWPFEILDDDNDLVALKLNADVAAKARAGWRVVRWDQCGDANGDGTFAVSGYPTCRVRRPTREDDRLGGSLITSYVERLANIPEDAAQPAEPAVDIFLLYKEDGTLANGDPFKSPKLHGVSGAPIWELDLPGGDSVPVWTPQNALRLVGVQTDARHFQYIRGKHWKIASKLFYRQP